MLNLVLKGCDALVGLVSLVFLSRGLWLGDFELIFGFLLLTTAVLLWLALDHAPTEAGNLDRIDSSVQRK